MVNFVGTAHSYVKALQTQKKAKMNFENAGIKNWGNSYLGGQTAVNPLFVIPASYDYYSDGVDKAGESDPKLESIILRLKQGRRLTSGEMSYLSEKSPEMYAKAVRINRERDEYEAELKNCKTKEDVRKLRVIKAQSLIPEINKASAKNDLSAATEIEMRLSAINDEHNSFVTSKLYARLPKNHEELRKKRDKARGGAFSQNIQKDTESTYTENKEAASNKSEQTDTGDIADINNDDCAQSEYIGEAENKHTVSFIDTEKTKKHKGKREE